LDNLFFLVVASPVLPDRLRAGCPQKRFESFKKRMGFLVSQLSPMRIFLETRVSIESRSGVHTTTENAFPTYPEKQGKNNLVYA